ncbi:MAG: hypothetical protein A3F42_01910 [Gammaproteobacteria bacterium RIFCSPHIGHO2_12_FULL_37_34]|nr:MAG: hypothetical protein A3F42_01910 [Gammaproteobacteria bacterium RIFCSPHIGHO2_12_FULL_37_34]
MNLLFYDVATPTLYHHTTLYERGLGGTEATIIRIAHSLKNNHTVYIAQHCRSSQDDCDFDGVQYISLASANRLTPDAVVLLREYEWINRVGELFPQAKHYFWIHNLPPRDLYITNHALRKHKYEIIAVSHFHKQTIIKRLKPAWYQPFRALKRINPAIKVSVIYNPIDDLLYPDYTKWDPNQLIFLSSPHKGLAECLKLFVNILKQFPDMKLLICNPGNWDSTITIPNSVQVLGTIPHYQVMEQVRRSLCVFYPQTKRAETFGLIYAEANAVGTPVLAHPVGSAKEVLSDPIQLVNGKRIKAVIRKIDEWRTKRPIIQGKDEFRLQQVTKNWLHLLADN